MTDDRTEDATRPLTEDEQRRLVSRALGADNNWFIRLQQQPGAIALEVLLVIGLFIILFVAGVQDGWAVVLDGLTDLAPWIHNGK